ncbi:MAG: UvrD-helicase domain-containing protein [Bacteroidetes bacterium]|nr:UvrD-helicase domain-containing protein [Bacteroidota bacterium]MBU1717775.1 UvrD-helicase domain-containing protein [Bacteroidota bacterium]
MSLKKFIVYNSSAGSGKTFTLVKEYLQIALADPSRFRHILGITFTNKAAGEMKERVITYLRFLLPDHPDDGNPAQKVLLPIIVKETGISVDILRKNAAQVLSNILHNYADFAISTIDSFMHRVIRSFAHDLRLPASFEVEMNYEQITAEAIDMLISKAGTDKDLTRLLVSYAESRITTEEGWDITANIQKLAEELFEEEGHRKIQLLKELAPAHFIDLWEKIFLATRNFEKRVKEQAEVVIRLLSGNNISPEVLYQGNRGIFSYFNRFTAGNFEKLEPGSYVIATFDDGKWTSGKAKQADKDAIDSVAPQIETIYRKIQDIIEKESADYRLYQVFLPMVYPLAMLNEIDRNVNELKKQENIVLISEFNSRIAEVVRSEPVPFIYEKTGEKYHHYMIDEFQDTSVMQWFNLLPLVENALAGGNRCLVVGDSKQAIYRFRNGDADQFVRLPDIPGEKDHITASRELALRRNYVGLSLNTNYRSAKAIVDFNNELFRFAADLVIPEHFRHYYKEVEQKLGSSDTGGYVSVEMIEREEELSYDDATTARIFEIVKECMANGFGYSDIAILCNSNNDGARIASDILIQGLPVVTAQSLLLGTSRDVAFIAGLIIALQYPRDAVVLSSLSKYMSESPLFADTEALRSVSRIDSLGVLAQIIQNAGFKFVPGQYPSRNVYETGEELVRLFGFHQKADAFIQFFLDKLLEFTLKTPGNTDFQTWWRDEGSVSSIVVPEGMDAVRIMTIHKSKGLEFPVVILPKMRDLRSPSTKNRLWLTPPDGKIPLPVIIADNNKKLLDTCFADSYTVEHDKSLIDRLNKYYVAFTRATERMYILSEIPSEKAEDEKLQVILKKYLTHKELWNDGELRFAFGSPLPKSGSATHKNADAKVLEEFISVPWLGRIRVRHSGDGRRSKAIEKGILIHEILSNITDPSQIEREIDTCIAEGRITSVNVDEIRDYVHRVLEMPELSGLFDGSWRQIAEQDIILPGGSIYRPDRVFIKGKFVAVVDFKTGKQRDKDITQITEYKSTLSLMGYDVLMAALLYIGEDLELVGV